ncbi:Uncharacterized protein PHSC3_000125 [Chlamydiales bacterium STE3]|nr:Uncharacterized protein PHSC3_000125 [Chlamydiales bacterium STE3]
MAQKELSKEILRHIRHIHIKMEHLATDLLAGMYRSAFKGKGMEFEDVREYQAGDDVRSIDWNVTARMNHPYVKNFREERELTVMLLVDISSSLKFGSQERLKNTILAEIAAVLAFSSIKNQDKVGLVLFSDQIEEYLPPAKGVRHVLRIIRDLLIFEAKSPKTNIANALAFLGKVQRQRAVVFLLSDFISRDFSNAAAIIAKKHDLIAISIQDPLEKTFPAVGIVHIQDLESGEEMLIDTNEQTFRKGMQDRVHQKRAALAKTFAELNAPLIEVSTEMPYLPQLRKFFKKRGKAK